MVAFKTNPAGMANGTVVGPLREAVTTLSIRAVLPSTLFVMEGDTPANPSKAALVSTK